MIKKWEQFWFNTAVDLKLIGLIRMLLGFVFFFFYLIRIFNFDLYYSDSGFLPSELLSTMKLDYSKNIYYLLDYSNYSFAFFMHVALLVGLLLLGLGVLNRLGTCVLLILHLYFIHRNPFINYGVDQYFCFWLFYLCFIQHSIYFSILRRNKQTTMDNWSNVGIRFFQIQLVVSYFYSGIDKLYGESWRTGVAVRDVLLNPNWSMLSSFSLPSNLWVWGVLTYFVLFFECFTPLALISKKIRAYWWPIAVIFHLGILLTLKLPFFSIMMLICLLVLIPSNYWQKLKASA